MKLKFLCCEVFFRMACLAAATSKHTVDFEFTQIKSDTVSDELRKLIQAAIDRTEDEGGYDAIILGYGLCGNATAGLKSKSLKLVIPRAHDCCTVFLGSVEKFMTHFSHRPSQPWTSHGYYERDSDYLGDTSVGKMLGYDKDYLEMVEKYGEENAQMIWETIHPPEPEGDKVYIKVDQFDELGFFDKFMAEVREKAAEVGEEKDVEIIEGSMRLINKLVNGDWDGEFLVAEPGVEIEPSYDLESVFIKN